MEHVVLSHMAKHLSKNNIIIDEQHGFRQRFSCETQLITTIHDGPNQLMYAARLMLSCLTSRKLLTRYPIKGYC